MVFQNKQLSLLKSLLVFFLIFIFFSCSSTKESVIDLRNSQIIAGFHKDAKYRIGITRKVDVPVDEFNLFKEDSLGLSFEDDSTDISHNPRLAFVSFSSSNYSTTKGITKGDSPQKAERIYGKPLATEINYWEDHQHNIGYVYYGLFYKNMTFITDRDHKKIKIIVVGNYKEFDPVLNKKYIKKQIR
jgi:hypothetical protein